MLMKQILMSITAIAVLVFGTNACAQRTIKSSKNYVTKEVKASNFNAIRVQGSPDVVYTQSDKVGIQIYGSDNIVDLLETTVDNGVLTVKFKSNTSIMNSGKFEVRASSPHLNKVHVQGSGDVTLANGIKGEDNLEVSIQGSGDIDGTNISCDNISISVQGSGDIKLSRITSSNVTATVAGSGDIDINGSCSSAVYSVAGSGDISAADLKADNVSAKVSGSGDIKCHATQVLKATVSGSGDIGYKGNPESTEFSKKGIYKL